MISIMQYTLRMSAFSHNRFVVNCRKFLYKISNMGREHGRDEWECLCTKFEMSLRNVHKICLYRTFDYPEVFGDSLQPKTSISHHSRPEGKKEDPRIACPTFRRKMLGVPFRIIETFCTTHVKQYRNAKTIVISVPVMTRKRDRTCLALRYCFTCVVQKVSIVQIAARTFLRVL